MLTTGTGSGKSLAYIVPIVDHVLRTRRWRRAADPGDRRLPDERAGQQPGGRAAEVPQPRLSRTARARSRSGGYTGQESDEQREEIRAHPPDILLTNYVMLEFILTRPFDQALVRAAQGLSFLVLDELHTYRGRQGADVALLVRRVREALQGDEPAVRRHVRDAGRPGHVRRAARRGRAGRDAACSARRSSRRASSARRCAARPPTSTSTIPASVARLTERVRAGQPPETYDETIADPLACWIERTLGIACNEADGRYVRCVPRPLTRRGRRRERCSRRRPGCRRGRLPRRRCRRRCSRGSRIRSPDGFPVFAFRLHQFFSGGSAVAVSLDAGAERYITHERAAVRPG